MQACVLYICAYLPDLTAFPPEPKKKYHLPLFFSPSSNTTNKNLFFQQHQSDYKKGNWIGVV